MKKVVKILLQILSYVLVAAAAVVITLFAGMKTGSYSKLEQLETLLLNCYINGADRTKLEDAAAHAMVGALGDRWSYYTLLF